MLDAFKLKPFDLEPIYASWTDGPKFDGNPKKDLPLEQWLEAIKAGCIERKVPEEYWYKVAQHFMTGTASARFRELKLVLAQINGGKFRWTWPKFIVAMKSLSFEIDSTVRETVEVKAKRSGTLWALRRGTDSIVASKSSENKTSKDTESQATANSQNKDGSRPSTLKTRSESILATLRGTDSGASSKASEDKSLKDAESQVTSDNQSKDGSRPSVIKSKSESILATLRGKPSRSRTMDCVPTIEKPGSTALTSESAGFKEKVKPPPPTRSQTLDFPVHEVAKATGDPAVTEEVVTAVASAPLWLLNACNAMDYLTSEHPKTMSALSAILITAGTIPALPAISAGAGGAILASHAAQAVGAIAVSVGTWIKTFQEGQSAIQSKQQATITEV